MGNPFRALVAVGVAFGLVALTMAGVQARLEHPDAVLFLFAGTLSQVVLVSVVFAGLQLGWGARLVGLGSVAVAVGGWTWLFTTAGRDALAWVLLALRVDRARPPTPLPFPDPSTFLPVGVAVALGLILYVAFSVRRRRMAAATPTVGSDHVLTALCLAGLVAPQVVLYQVAFMPDRLRNLLRGAEAELAQARLEDFRRTRRRLRAAFSHDPMRAAWAKTWGGAKRLDELDQRARALSQPPAPSAPPALPPPERPEPPPEPPASSFEPADPAARKTFRQACVESDRGVQGDPRAAALVAADLGRVLEASGPAPGPRVLAALWALFPRGPHSSARRPACGDACPTDAAGALEVLTPLAEDPAWGGMADWVQRVQVSLEVSRWVRRVVQLSEETFLQSLASKRAYPEWYPDHMTPRATMLFGLRLRELQLARSELAAGLEPVTWAEGVGTWPVHTWTAEQTHSTWVTDPPADFEALQARLPTLVPDEAWRAQTLADWRAVASGDPEAFGAAAVRLRERHGWPAPAGMSARAVRPGAAELAEMARQAANAGAEHVPVPRAWKVPPEGGAR